VGDVRRSEPARAARDQRGAAAVEFALVLMLLIPMLFGIVDYGLWFSDSLAVRHGVHEAARVGVVQRASCGATLAQIACSTAPQVGSVGGPTYAMVKAPQGWTRGKPLVVCAMVQENGLTGVTPLPGRMVRAKAELAIEVVDIPVTTTTPGYSPAGAASMDWSWCT
jgi:Flp pilus assembly protein TadG